MTKQSKIYGYYVEGSRYGGFPMDMLRYGQSYPIDADIIDGLIRASENGDYSRFPEKRVKIKLCTSVDPTSYTFKCITDRFKSFGWTVTEVTDYEQQDDGFWYERSALEESLYG